MLQKPRLRNKILPTSLFGRSLLILAVPIILLQLIVGFVFFDRNWDSMNEKLVFALTGEIDMLSKRLAAAPHQSAIDEIIQQAGESLEILVIIDPEQKRVDPNAQLEFEKTWWFSIGPRLRNALHEKISMPFAVRPYEKERWFEIQVEYKEGKVARFLCHDRRLTSATTYIFVLWLIGSAVVLFGIALAFMRNQIRPIMRLAVAAEKLGKGQDVPNFRPIGAREVRQAAHAFLQMRDRRKRQIEQRTAMLAGVSHDLRTPITRMKLQMAMAHTAADIESMRQDVDEMERMIEGYLSFARGEGDEQSEGVNLVDILARVATNARRQGATVVETLPERLPLRARPLALERAIANVVNNAAKFAKNIWISAYEQSGVIEVVVDDDGPGIPIDQREDVFRPFYRVEKSRNKKTGGVGLGLSIAQDIVHGHGGEIFLEDSNRGGLRVVIRLPL